jgi:hypothetical protein
MLILCEYGCNQEAKYQFQNGKWCCSETFSKCQAVKNINRQKQIDGWKTNRQSRIKNRMGHIPWNKGLKNCFSKDTIIKMKKSQTGKKHKPRSSPITDIERQKIGQSHLGSKAWNRFTYEFLKEKHPEIFQVEEIIKDVENDYVQVKCKYCGNWFTPTYSKLGERIRYLKRKSKTRKNYFYCCNEHKKLCPEHQRNCLEGIRQTKNSNSKWGIKGYFFSNKTRQKHFFRSVYELAYLDFLESSSDIIFFESEPISIKYENSGKFFYYIPDFLVTNKDGKTNLVEVKPEYYVREENNLIKFKAAEKFCSDRDIEFKVISEISYELKDLKLCNIAVREIKQGKLQIQNIDIITK